MVSEIHQRVPSLTHEVLIELFRARPLLAAELLTVAHVLEPGQVVEGSLVEASLTQVVPTEFRADAVVRLHGTELDAIVESQLRPDPDKRRVWPLYVAAVHARTGRCAVLLVITLDRGTARWAREPMAIGPGSLVRAVVIGPDDIPIVADVATAMRAPEVAVLSAMAHGKEPKADEIALVAGVAAADLDVVRKRLYLELILEHMDEAARAALENLMIENWEPKNPVIRRIEAEGRALGLEEGRALQIVLDRIKEHLEAREEGIRVALVHVLASRFGPLPEEVETRIAAAHESQLLAWTGRILTADSLPAVFG
jgi:hypothetical protein